MEKIVATLIFGIIILYCMYVLYKIFVINRRNRKLENSNKNEKDTSYKNILNKFINKKPRCLEGYNIKDSPPEIINTWLQGPEFLSKLLKCKCGEEKLYVYASSNNEVLLAPIYLECPKCLTKNLIFNPSIHGWDGENGDNTSIIGENEPHKVNKLPRRVIVDYSFQGPDSYADLINDGTKNPEDYFDVFIISTQNESGKLEEVVSYECA